MLYTTVYSDNGIGYVLDGYPSCIFNTLEELKLTWETMTNG